MARNALRDIMATHLPPHKGECGLQRKDGSAIDDVSQLSSLNGSRNNVEVEVDHDQLPSLQEAKEMFDKMIYEELPKYELECKMATDANNSLLELDGIGTEGLFLKNHLSAIVTETLGTGIESDKGFFASMWEKFMNFMKGMFKKVMGLLKSSESSPPEVPKDLPKKVVTVPSKLMDVFILRDGESFDMLARRFRLTTEHYETIAKQAVSTNAKINDQFVMNMFKIATYLGNRELAENSQTVLDLAETTLSDFNNKVYNDWFGVPVKLSELPPKIAKEVGTDNDAIESWINFDPFFLNLVSIYTTIKEDRSSKFKIVSAESPFKSSMKEKNVQVDLDKLSNLNNLIESCYETARRRLESSLEELGKHLDTMDNLVQKLGDRSYIQEVIDNYKKDDREEVIANLRKIDTLVFGKLINIWREFFTGLVSALSKVLKVLGEVKSELHQITSSAIKLGKE